MNQCVKYDTSNHAYVSSLRSFRSMPVESVLKENLGIRKLEVFGGLSSGCISEGQGYNTENGKIFLKKNTKKEASMMFKGEAISLNYILETGAINAPRPLKVLDFGDNEWGLVTTFIDLRYGRGDMNNFGTRLANMHKNNEHLVLSTQKARGFVGRVNHIHEHDIRDEEQIKYGIDKYGFAVTTCCGFFPQQNDWCNDWASFFIRNRLQPQIDQLLYKGERDLYELWPHLLSKATTLLTKCQNVIPALVHGDLWSGNWGFSKDEPIIFDPASFFADPEFEEGIMNMFGGYSCQFWKSYHEVVPMQDGREKRVQLYELFHSLNHWNHFGSTYKSTSLSLIYKILDMQKQIK